MEQDAFISRPSRKRRYLFWLTLGTLSAYLAEVPSGSFLWPFFLPQGLILVTPLYTLHTLLLAWLIFRFGPPRLSTLYMAGALFGMYEAYMTKVVWMPFWGDPENVTIVAGIAFWETVVICFAWHPFFSFILPLLIGESQCTATRGVARVMPWPARWLWRTRFRRFFAISLLVLFMGLFLGSVTAVKEQREINVFLPCLLSSLVPLGLIHLCRRRLRSYRYSMQSLLPQGREVAVLAGLLAIYYLLMGFFVRTEIIPGINGQLTVLILYALIIGLLATGLRQARLLRPLQTVPRRQDWLRLWQMSLFVFVFAFITLISPRILGPSVAQWVLIFWLLLAFWALCMWILTIIDIIKGLFIQKDKEGEHAELV